MEKTSELPIPTSTPTSLLERIKAKVKKLPPHRPTKGVLSEDWLNENQLLYKK